MMRALISNFIYWHNCETSSLTASKDPSLRRIILRISIEIKMTFKATNRLNTHMEALCSTENIRLYDENRRRVKTLINPEKIALRRHCSRQENKNNTTKFFSRYKNSKKHTRGGIRLLKENAGNLMTNDQNMADIMNDWFCSVFITPAEADHISTNDNDTNN